MIIVTGASGKLGRLVVDQLAERVDPSTIVATARSTEKLADLAERGIVTRQLDYNDPATIESALEGATQVLLISGMDFGQRVEQHANVIKAAAAVGVEHLAYTSVLRADTSTLPVAPEHKGTEEILDRAPMTTTLLRNGWYTENYTENLAPALANGALIGAARSGRIAAATRADYATAAAVTLADPAMWGGTYELAGPAFTMEQLAATVSEVGGNPIPYVDMSADDLRGALTGAGLPAHMVDFMVAADLGIAQGELDGSSSDLEQLLGRPATSLESAVKAALAA